jgi:hypothetical protein
VSEALAAEGAAQTRRQATCHKRWLNGGSVVHCLVEAPDEETLRSVHEEIRLPAHELTELFAPLERWLAVDSVDA